MFPSIQTLDDLAPLVAGKKEIRISRLPNGTTLACYMFMDSSTFDSPHAMECRGITFDAEGRVCSRPLHKFFNMGEKAWLTPDSLLARESEVVGVFEKLDGSMLATAWVDGALAWRSKKSFASDVVRLTEQFLADPAQQHLVEFANAVASRGMTAIFELTHPQARIVVDPKVPELRLLHVRDNVTGAYVLLDAEHPIQALVQAHRVPLVPRFSGMSLSEVFASLETMEEQEGYVIQFANGDMVKLKCAWYQRLHRSITFLRERDIAMSALNEELDDLKAVLAEAGIDLAPVLEVESRLKARLVGIMDELDAVIAADGSLERKAFALKHNKHPLFGLLMMQYQGKEVPLKDWFAKNRLREEFSLRVLADGALAEAMEG